MLSESGGLSQGELQRREGELRQAEGTLIAADATVTAAENLLHVYGLDQAVVESLARSGEIDPRYEVRAPISGTVIERTVESGQIIASATGNVSGGTTLLKLADLTDMRVRMLVDETDIGQVTRGMTARVTAQAFPGRTFVGVVEKLEPQAVVNQNVTMFPVLVSLPNPEGLLKPGMNAQVAIEVARRANVLAISIEAVVAMREVAAVAKTLGVAPEAVSAMGDGESANGGQAGADEGRAAVVFIEKPTGLEPRLVRVGLSDWEYTEVLSGLEEGESVRLVNTTPPSEQEPGGFGGAGARQGGAP
jgi:HlyD family secretion protein